eukprot:365241-Chlamydomonas_euryale.AAC.23
MGSSSSSRRGTHGKIFSRSSASTAAVALPGGASVPGAGATYTSGSIRKFIATSEAMRRQKKRLSPDSAPLATTSHTEGNRLPSMTAWCCASNSDCCGRGGGGNEGRRESWS